MYLYNKLSEQLISVGLADWANVEDIENVYESVSKLEPGQNYLEIGVAKGASLSVACLAAKEGVNLYGIDLIDWEDRPDKIQKMLDLNQKQFTWFYIDGDSQMTAKSWDRGPIHVLYIDGDHTREGVLRDLVSWIPRVATGGRIIFDDYNLKTGVKQAVDGTILNNELFTNQKAKGESFSCTKSW